MSVKPLHVVAAAVVNERGEVLVARRHDHLHQGGLWEFPGGKVEPGEGVRHALSRELQEELGIRPLQQRPLIRVHHDYPDRSVLLDVWQVTAFSGTPHGREGQPVEWVPADELHSRDFPAANLPILTAVRLPDLYAITGEPEEGDEAFLARLAQVCAGGVRLVQLRAKSLSPERYLALAAEAVAVAHRHGAAILLNGEPQWVERTGADGVHLESRRLMALEERPLAASRWVAASCHDPAELAHAARIGVDFAVVSPVLPTRSHPGVSTLGWAGLRALTEAAPMPVFALGGLGPDDCGQVQRFGAQGVAAISALWMPGGRP